MKLPAFPRHDPWNNDLQRPGDTKIVAISAMGVFASKQGISIDVGLSGALKTDESGDSIDHHRSSRLMGCALFQIDMAVIACSGDLAGARRRSQQGNPYQSGVQ